MLLSTSPVSSTFGVRAFTLLAWQGRYKVLPSHFHPGLFKCKAELFEGKAWLVGGRGVGNKRKGPVPEEASSAKCYAQPGPVAKIPFP